MTSVQQGFDILDFAVPEFRPCILHRLNGIIYLSRREARLRPCVLHLRIWLEQNYTTHLDEHGPISFCFYYTPEFHRKHETTRQKSQSLWTILRHDVFLIIPIDTIRTYIDQPNRSSLFLVIMHWRIGEDILVPFSI